GDGPRYSTRGRSRHRAVENVHSRDEEENAQGTIDANRNAGVHNPVASAQGRLAVAKSVVGKADARAEIELGGAENAAGYAAMAVVNYSVELIGRRPCGGQRRAVRSLHEQAVGLYRRRFGRVPGPGG